MPKKRGRPAIDDTSYLMQIANLLAEGKATTPRSAIQRVVGSDDSVIRRLQRKWRKDGKIYLASAKKRHQEQQTQRSSMASVLGLGMPVEQTVTGMMARESIHRQIAESAALRQELLAQAGAINELARAARGPFAEHRQALAAVESMRKTIGDYDSLAHLARAMKSPFSR